MSLPEKSFVARSLMDRRSPTPRRTSLGTLFSSQDIILDRRKIKDRRNGWEDRENWERNSEWSSILANKDHP